MEVLSRINMQIVSLEPGLSPWPRKALQGAASLLLEGWPKVQFILSIWGYQIQAGWPQNPRGLHLVRGPCCCKSPGVMSVQLDGGPAGSWERYIIGPYMEGHCSMLQTQQRCRDRVKAKRIRSTSCQVRVNTAGIRWRCSWASPRDSVWLDKLKDAIFFLCWSRWTHGWDQMPPGAEELLTDARREMPSQPTSGGQFLQMLTAVVRLWGDWVF